MDSEALERLEELRRISDESGGRPKATTSNFINYGLYRTAVMDAVPELISAAKRNVTLKAELEAVKTKSDLNINAMRYLELLTPGGSEFYGDPERCFNYAMSKRKTMIETAKKAVMRANMLQAQLEAADAVGEGKP